MMILAAVVFAFTSCQKEEIEPIVGDPNDPTSLPTFQYEESGIEHELIDVKDNGQIYTVYIYHFFDTDQASGELYIEKSNGQTVTYTFQPKHLRDTFLVDQNMTCYYLKRSIDLSYDEILNMNGWFHTTVHLDQNVGVIKNVNYFNGAVAQRSDVPVYCGIDPVSTVYQTNQLSTSFFVDFSTLPVISEGVTVVE